MRKGRLELFRDGRFRVIESTLRHYGYKNEKQDSDSNSDPKKFIECIESIVGYYLWTSPDPRSYLERHFGDQQQIEDDFELEPGRPGNPAKGRKFTMGTQVEHTKYWHLNPEKESGLNPGKFEVHGVDTADLLITRVVHCIWRAIACETRKPLSSNNPLGDFEENKDFYTKDIFWTITEHVDHYLGNEEFNEVSALEAQHITALKRRLQTETLLKKMGFATSNSEARVKYLRKTLRLSNAQLIELLKETQFNLKCFNEAVDDNDDCTGHADPELERSIEKLLLETERSHAKSSAKTQKARKKSSVIRSEDATERRQVLLAMCRHLLNSDERLSSLFTDVNQKKRREQITKACFQFNGEPPTAIGHVICDDATGLQFKWHSVRGKARKFIKHPEENRWVEAYTAPPPTTPFKASQYSTFWNSVNEIDKLRGLLPRKAASNGTFSNQRKKRRLGESNPFLEKQRFLELVPLVQELHKDFWGKPLDLTWLDEELDPAWLETGGCVPEFEEGADSFLGIPVDRDQ